MLSHRWPLMLRQSDCRHTPTRHDYVDWGSGNRNGARDSTVRAGRTGRRPALTGAAAAAYPSAVGRVAH
jgi:hypothetical protein